MAAPALDREETRSLFQAVADTRIYRSIDQRVLITHMQVRLVHIIVLYFRTVVCRKWQANTGRRVIELGTPFDSLKSCAKCSLGSVPLTTYHMFPASYVNIHVSNANSDRVYKPCVISINTTCGKERDA